jgi:hypothetical protein
LESDVCKTVDSGRVKGAVAEIKPIQPINTPIVFIRQPIYTVIVSIRELQVKNRVAYRRILRSNLESEAILGKRNNHVVKEAVLDQTRA